MMQFLKLILLNPKAWSCISVAIFGSTLSSCTTCGTEGPINEGSRILTKKYLVVEDSVNVKIIKAGVRDAKYNIALGGQDPSIIVSNSDELLDTIYITMTFDEVYSTAQTEYLAIDDFVNINDSLGFSNSFTAQIFACTSIQGNVESPKEAEIYACDPVFFGVSLKKIEIQHDPKKSILASLMK